jgi:molybdate transport system regulatory protein
MRKEPRPGKGLNIPALKGHIWIEGSEGTFLGYGRIALLERIRDYGSITKAAKALEISYRRAWIMIDSMNRQAPEPYVITATGGKGGGGTHITEAGEEAVRTFWKIHDGFQVFLEDKDRAVKALYTSGKARQLNIHAQKRRTKKTGRKIRTIDKETVS